MLALGSNVLFMAYGYVDHLYPVLILHVILFPVKALRLVQFKRLVNDIRDAHREDLSIQSLLPYMKRKMCKKLHFQDRSFGFAVLQLIIARLVENNEREMHAKAT